MHRLTEHFNDGERFIGFDFLQQAKYQNLKFLVRPESNEDKTSKF
ncbi:hypothetical protein CAMGR0001_1223 [Campylobacter gracilis RM3268]|uniref:Uncharacterized protein n=1 Tax=Campylobacter gracilis RM3268 TaxID=553220 RepID=C8PJ24_9BACT|nr:hypothetical protein CAMGR0001_1223 [Campylobacter gracilis RM3268]